MPASAAGDPSPRRDHLQIVAPGDVEADASLRERSAALDATRVGGRQVGAVGVEPLGQPAQRALQHAVEIDELDIVVRDERDDVLEDAQVPVGLLFLAGRRAAVVAADDCEGDDWNRCEEDDDPDLQDMSSLHKQARCAAGRNPRRVRREASDRVAEHAPAKSPF